MLQQIVFFLKVTLYSVTIVIQLPQKHQYVHLTAYDYPFNPGSIFQKSLFFRSSLETW